MTTPWSKAGGSAFPVVVSEDSSVDQHGMTLRDYFAAKAMHSVPEMTSCNMKDCETYENYIARRSYAIADAMLKEREK